MRIIHMSDLHLTQDGSTIWGEDTREKFIIAIDMIKKMQDIDAILVSGDISNDGSFSSYIFADRLFSSTNIPTYWSLGNHDNLDLLKNNNLLSYCKLVCEATIYGWQIIILNSIAHDEEQPGKNRSRGVIDIDTMIKIKNQIYTKKKPTIVVLHHPALEIGGWQDLKILKNRDKFREIIESSEYVRIVLAGHIHEFTDRTLNGIRYSTAPGLGFAFSSKLANYEIQHGAEGFSLITINKNKILINKIALR